MRHFQVFDGTSLVVENQLWPVLGSVSSICRRDFMLFVADIKSEIRPTTAAVLLLSRQGCALERHVLVNDRTERASTRFLFTAPSCSCSLFLCLASIKPAWVLHYCCFFPIERESIRSLSTSLWGGGWLAAALACFPCSHYNSLVLYMIL